MQFIFDVFDFTREIKVGYPKILSAYFEKKCSTVYSKFYFQPFFTQFVKKSLLFLMNYHTGVETKVNVLTFGTLAPPLDTKL